MLFRLYESHISGPFCRWTYQFFVKISLPEQQNPQNFDNFLKLFSRSVIANLNHPRGKCYFLRFRDTCSRIYFCHPFLGNLLLKFTQVSHFLSTGLYSVFSLGRWFGGLRGWAGVHNERKGEHKKQKLIIPNQGREGGWAFNFRWYFLAILHHN